MKIHLLTFLLTTLPLITFAQTRTEKTVYIITKLELVDTKLTPFNLMLEDLKSNADEIDSLKIVEIEKQITYEEILKRITFAFDSIFTDEEINIIYTFFQSSVFDKWMNGDYAYKTLYLPFKDIDKEIENIRQHIIDNKPYPNTQFTPIYVTRPDGFYETLNYNPEDEKENVQLAEEPSILISEILEAKKKAVYMSNPPEISITLNKTGSQKFKTLTQNNIGKPLTIVIDNYIVSMPMVYEPIANGKITISGDFSEEEADLLIEKLNIKK